MSWFKTDDGFWCHRKLMRMSGAVRLLAAGAWVIAASWSSQQLTDGHVGHADLPAIFPGVPPKLLTTAIRELVRQGLWEEADDGWQFHDWLARNPSRAQVEADRAKRAAKSSVGGRKSQCIQRHGADCGCYQLPANVTRLHPPESLSGT